MQKIDGAFFKNSIALQGLYCILRLCLRQSHDRKLLSAQLNSYLSANPQNGQTPSNNSSAKAFEHISHLGLVFLFLTLSK